MSISPARAVACRHATLPAAKASSARKIPVCLTFCFIVPSSEAASDLSKRLAHLLVTLAPTRPLRYFAVKLRQEFPQTLTHAERTRRHGLLCETPPRSE